ncbi:MAG: hypothetical protein D6731_23850 [Planctomycetota bacterium]|nr:MAG: hypothetical protein D6731_23850 [Planctomycetota bacterium]
MPGLVLVACLAGPGCVSGPFQPTEALKRQLAVACFPLLDGSNLLAGTGVVVRATQDAVALAAFGVGPERGPLRVGCGPEPGAGPAQLRPLAQGLALVELKRGELELAAVRPGARPRAGELVFVCHALPNQGVVCGLASVAEVRSTRLRLLELPSYGSDDPRGADEVAEDLPGAAVFDLHGGFLGFVYSVLDEQPLVRRCGALLEPLGAGLSAWDGAERLGPKDGLLVFSLRLERGPRSSELPAIEDEWGEADLFLLLEEGEHRVGSLEVTPGRSVQVPVEVWTRGRGPVTARLVERDVTLFAGEVDQDLAPPLQVPLEDPIVCAFEVSLASSVVGRGGRPVRKPRVRLRLEERGAERSSGRDRFPLGARPLGLGRVGTGSVDRRAGDTTDFWSVEVGPGGAVGVIFLQERPGARLEVGGFAPGRPASLLEENSSGERLRVFVGEAPPGALLLRVRDLGPALGKKGYGLLAFPRGEPADALARALLRLVGRVSAEVRPGLGTLDFAREVYTALSSHLGYSFGELARAFLSTLGQGTREARRLNLYLLTACCRPALDELEAARRSALEAGAGSAGRQRARDAALLLALRLGSPEGYAAVLARARGLPTEATEAESPLFDRGLSERLRAEARSILEGAVLDAAADSDPAVRLLALGAAAAWREATTREALRRALLGRLAEDPSPRVRRALVRAFPRPARARTGS